MARLLAPLAAMALILLPASAASAHPLDVSRQTSYVTVGPDTVTVEVELAAGVLVAPAFIADLDRDHDKTFSAAESRGYAERVLAGLTLRVDDVPVPLALTGAEAPTYLQAQAGYGVLHVTATAPLAEPAGDHTLFYRDDFAPDKPQYQAAVLTPKNSPIQVGEQRHDEKQQQVETTFTVLGDTVEAAPPGTASRGWGIERLLSMIQDPSRSLGVTVAAVALAMMLGAFHALTPGHGKTMMAAYLVGGRARVRDALALGASVTVTHTSSVFVIGLAALLAGRFAVPDVLVPALELISGALVLGLGLRMLWQRLPWRRKHSHDHDHPHDHSHAPASGRVGLASVVALGVSGGLVPCPEALGVMILAVGLGHIAVGLLLILSFSAGLAAVLIGIGILLVRARTLAYLPGRLRTETTARLGRLLPLTSAAVVVVLGAGLLVRTVAATI
ncbi:nickel/cobalt transporter [Actinoplanes sp. HUAS TT8]|uniref:nickel/cobalt transporter n=1 Tax=Actinoplanes sp. HUAS TT8 TaxID=3447453 RepID=UPI003F520E1C